MNNEQNEEKSNGVQRTSLHTPYRYYLSPQASLKSIVSMDSLNDIPSS